ATISVSPTAWATAGASSDLTTSSNKAEASMTTGIVVLGVRVLGIVQAQRGGKLGFPLGPGGVEHLRRLAGAKLHRLPGREPFEPLPAARQPPVPPDEIEHIVGHRYPFPKSRAAQGLVQLLRHVLHLDRSHGHEASMLLACR